MTAHLPSHLPSHLAKLARLRADARDHVLERACLIADGCRIPYAEADVLAYGAGGHLPARVARDRVVTPAKEAPRMTEEWRQHFDDVREVRSSLGLCERCDEPTRPGRLHCAACAAKANAASLARYRAKTGALPSSRRCSICRVVGHSRRLCPTTEVPA